MGSFADFIEDAFLDHLVGKTAYTMPTAYVGLFTTAPTDAGGGVEVSGGSYVRQSTIGDDWNASSGGSISNVNDITFPEATADWGTVTHFALFDASSGGNMLAWGALTTSKTIETGEIAKFAGATPGDLVLTLD